MKAILIQQLLQVLMMVLSPEVLKKLIDTVLDVVEDAVENSPSPRDNMIVLPIVATIRSAFNVPDDDFNKPVFLPPDMGPAFHVDPYPTSDTIMGKKDA